MGEFKHWVGLSTDDYQDMLISLTGYRFGKEPEKHVEEIRAERSGYMNKFIRLAGVKPDDTVLELGSGCGFGTRALAAKAGRVLACDISPAYLSVAKNELDGLDNVSFYLVNNHDLSGIEDASVDKVVSVSVFIHFNLYDIYLNFINFKRVLKRKGRVVFDFSDMHKIEGPLHRKATQKQFLEHVRFYGEDPTNLPGLVQWNSASGITRVAKLAGFQRVKKRGSKLVFQVMDSAP